MRKHLRLLLSAAALTAASALCVSPLTAFAAEPDDLWDEYDPFAEEVDTASLLAGVSSLSELSLEELEAIPLDSPLWELGTDIADEEPQDFEEPDITEEEPPEESVFSSDSTEEPDAEISEDEPEESADTEPSEILEETEETEPEDEFSDEEDFDLLPFDEAETAEPDILFEDDLDASFLLAEEAAPVTVEIKWTELNFTYTPGEWDSEQLCYGPGVWTEDHGSFTVTNTSTTAVTLSCAFTCLNSGISGSFAVDDVVTAYTMPDGSLAGYPLAAGETAAVTLQLSGEPEQAWKDVSTIGTLSLTVAVDPLAAPADISEPIEDEPETSGGETAEDAAERVQESEEA